MTTLVVFGGIALLVAAYFALDMWAEGRKARRSTLQPRDGQVGKAGDYDVMNRQDHEGLRGGGHSV
jgi:hypothetical protein